MQLANFHWRAQRPPLQSHPSQRESRGALMKHYACLAMEALLVRYSCYYDRHMAKQSLHISFHICYIPKRQASSIVKSTSNNSQALWVGEVVRRLSRGLPTNGRKRSLKLCLW